MVENWTQTAKDARKFVAKKVLPALMITSVGCSNAANFTPQIKDIENCTSSLVISAHYFKPSSEGSVEFKPGNEILGPAVGRRYLAKAIGGDPPEIFVTGHDGIVDHVTSEFGTVELNDSAVPFNGIVSVNSEGTRTMDVAFSSLQNGSAERYSIPCDATGYIDVKVPENNHGIDDLPNSADLKQ